MKKKDRKDKARHKNKLRKQKIEKIESGTRITEEDCGITDETLTRMKRQIVERYGFEHEVVRDSALEKMSDILVEYGEPLLETIDTDDKAEYEKGIMMAIMFWNCAIMQDTPKGRREVEKTLKPMMRDAESKSVVKYMLNRKREMFPENNRIMMNYELSETPDGLHLSIVSSIPMME